MADLENSLTDPAAAGGGPEAGAGTGGAGAGAAETSGGWAGPSQEEWNALNEQNKRLADSIEGLTSAFGTAETGQTGGDEFDLSQLDMTDPYQAAWLMDQVVNARMSSVAPYVRSAANDQGQRQLGELLSTHEKDLSKDYPAGFDKKLAERAAFAFFDETGDARGSVEMAARYAAEVRKAERDAAIEEYRAKNKRGSAFGDPSAGESGVTAPPPLKSYDEVLAKYTSQSEI